MRAHIIAVAVVLPLGPCKPSNCLARDLRAVQQTCPKAALEDFRWLVDQMSVQERAAKECAKRKCLIWDLAPAGACCCWCTSLLIYQAAYDSSMFI
jgi:hypothetical protein